MRVILLVVARLLGAFLVLVAWFVATVGLVTLLGLPAWTVWLTLVPFLAFWIWKGLNRWIVGTALGALVILALWLAILQPRNDRDWWPETSVLPRIEIAADGLVTIHDLRHFKWRTSDDYDPIWETQRYELSRLDRLELIVVPLDKRGLVAHTMLGFGFNDGRQIIVSAEARKEKGEDYALIAGELNQFELIYVIGAEEDLLTTRAIARGDVIYAYPIRATPEFIQSLFRSLAESANKLHEEPEFYSSTLKNCTMTLVQHIDRQPGQKPIGVRFETLFPGQSPKLVYNLGRIDTDLSFEEARKTFRIDEAVRQYAGKPGFSQLIREQ